MPSRMMLLLSTAILSGCIPTSVYPLSDPGKSKIDDRLIGKWKSPDAELWNTPEADFMVIRKPVRKDLPSGVLEIVEPKAKQDEKVFVFTTALEGTSYVNFFGLKTTESWNGAKPLYVLAKYQVDRHRLRYWLLDNNECAKAVAQKQIDGEVKSGFTKSIVWVTFTDSQANLARFLVREADRIWQKEPSIAFTRVE